MGRPLLDSPSRRRNQVAVYLNDREYELAYHAAVKQHQPIAVFLRSVILREVEKKEAHP